jgi:hypothetical protein
VSGSCQRECLARYPGCSPCCCHVNTERSPAALTGQAARAAGQAGV